MNLENVSTGKDRKTISILMLGVILAVFTVACLAMAGAVSAADDSGTAVGSDDVKTVTTENELNDVAGTWTLPDGTTVVFGEEQTGVMTDADGTKFIFSWKKTDDGKYQVTREDNVQYLWTLNKDGTMTNSAGTILTKEESAVSDAAADIIDKIDAISETVSETISEAASETIFGTIDDSGATVVTNETALKNAVANGGTVKLGNDISMSSQLDIKNKVILDLNGHTLDLSKYNDHIYVHSGGDLTLNDSLTNGKLCGRSYEEGGCIYVDNGGKVTINGGNISGSTESGVYLNTGAMFIMNGGSITDNEGGLCNGMGVYVNADATFIMNDGEISDNHLGLDFFQDNPGGGGVYVNGGTFTMNGGSIKKNTTYRSNGGGVYMNGGTFTMTGGQIYENNVCTSSVDKAHGSGVYLINGATFNMEGGCIRNNYARTNGSGVFIKNSNVTMSGNSVISGNYAGEDGGGVYLESGTFTMNGGTISGNEASDDNGGGVYVKDGTFTMNGGTISENIAPGSSVSKSYGGGVCVDSNGTFIMTGGVIKNNKVRTNGGGVMVRDAATISISGSAQIIDNTKSDGKTSSNLCWNGNNKLTLNGALSEDIVINYPNPKEGSQFGTATEGASGEEHFHSGDGKLVGAISDGKLIWKKVSGTDSGPEAKTSSKSTLTSLFDEKSGNGFTFKRPVVITKATLPGAASATVTSTSGSGWYTCHLVPVGTSVTLKSMNSPVMAFSTSRFHWM